MDPIRELPLQYPAEAENTVLPRPDRRPRIAVRILAAGPTVVSKATPVPVAAKQVQIRGTEALEDVPVAMIRVILLTRLLGVKGGLGDGLAFVEMPGRIEQFVDLEGERDGLDPPQGLDLRLLADVASGDQVGNWVGGIVLRPDAGGLAGADQMIPGVNQVPLMGRQVDREIRVELVDLSLRHPQIDFHARNRSCGRRFRWPR